MISLWSHFRVDGGDLSNVAPLLEFLTIFPEELTRADIPADRKSKVSAELCNGFARVLALLEQCFDFGDAALKQGGLRCLQSWIVFEVPVTSLPPIISRTLRQLPDEQTFHAAIEVLCELVSHPKSVHFETSICDGILTELTTGWFRQRFHENFEGTFDAHYGGFFFDTADESFVKPVCSLLVAFGETFTGYIIKNFVRPDVVSLLQMILRCTDYPGCFAADEEISDLTLNFWYILQDTLLDEFHVPSLAGPRTLDLDGVDASMDSINMGSVEDALDGSPDGTAQHSMASGVSGETAASDVENMVKTTSELLYLELCKVLRRKCRYPAEAEWIRWPVGMSDVTLRL